MIDRALLQFESKNVKCHWPFCVAASKAILSPESRLHCKRGHIAKCSRRVTSVTYSRVFPLMFSESENVIRIRGAKNG
jgi:hypothetical protein